MTPPLAILERRRSAEGEDEEVEIGWSGSISAAGAPGTTDGKNCSHKKKQ
jgi:hypothetical protein